MNNGLKYHILNPIFDNLKEWIRAAFMPGGVQKRWFEVVIGTYIQISQIQEVRIMTDEEVREINTPKIIPIQETATGEFAVTSTNEEVQEKTE